MKVVNFNKLAIQNFLSVGEEPVVIEFKSGLHILTGRNIDKPERKNAVGKSTIADGLYFAIFGETLREIKKDLIVNNITGGKTHVELDFNVNSPRGNNCFKIIRTLSPTKVYVYKDGVDKTRDSLQNTTKYICEVLSASPAIFQNCVIMTVNNATPFMAKSKVDKRRFIEDIFGMEIFGRMTATVRAEYNEIKKNNDINAAKYEEISTSLSSYIKQQQFENQKRLDKINLYTQRFKNNLSEIQQLENDLLTVQANICSVHLDNQYDQLQATIVTLENKIVEVLEKSTHSKLEINSKKDQYGLIGTSLSKCPVCLKSVDEHDKTVIESEKATIKKEIILLASNYKKYIEENAKNKELLANTKAEVLIINKEKADIQLQLQKQHNISTTIDKLKNWQQELTVDIDDLNTANSNLDGTITDIEKRQTLAKSMLDDSAEVLNKLDIVKFIISEEGVRSYIVNKLLELLNNKLYLYLEQLDSNSSCCFNEFFEEEIVNDKGKICSYFNFSGAERKAIDLACLFAFSDLRRIQGNVCYNIAIYDELFDSSFDERGIELVSNILQERVESINECNIVISHRKESYKFATGDIIMLEKENGITKRVFTHSS